MFKGFSMLFVVMFSGQGRCGLCMQLFLSTEDHRRCERKALSFGTSMTFHAVAAIIVDANIFVVETETIIVHGFVAEDWSDIHTHP